MANSQPTIPRKGISEPSVAVYRPPPSQSEAGPSTSASSPNLSQYQSQIQHDEIPSTPPPYSGPVSPSSSSNRQAQLSSRPPRESYPGLPHLDYRLYSPSSFVLNSDTTTLSSRDPSLHTSPAALTSLVLNLASIPPKPQIRILGKTGDNVDFDVKINCMNLIVPENEKAKMNYVKVIGKGELGYRGEGKMSREEGGDRELGVGGWVDRFLRDGRGIKYFALERTVQNWDTSYLEGRILTLINSTSYKGHITITFPTTHSRVVIHSPDKINRLFSSITKVFTGTKKYEVVKSVWPYADLERGKDGRRCAVQDEEEWFCDWRDAIRHAVMGKRKGWVTIEDRLEFLMEPKLGEVEVPSWGI